MATSKDNQLIDLKVQVRLLEKMVDKLQDRCDEACVKARQAEDLVKQVIEAVGKITTQMSEKDPWEDSKQPASEPVVVPDELSGLVDA